MFFFLCCLHTLHFWIRKQCTYFYRAYSVFACRAAKGSNGFSNVTREATAAQSSRRPQWCGELFQKAVPKKNVSYSFVEISTTVSTRCTAQYYNYIPNRNLETNMARKEIQWSCLDLEAFLDAWKRSASLWLALRSCWWDRPKQAVWVEEGDPIPFIQGWLGVVFRRKAGGKVKRNSTWPSSLTREKKAP